MRLIYGLIPFNSTQGEEGGIFTPSGRQGIIFIILSSAENWKKLFGHGWFIHAPCTISNIREDKDSVKLTVDGWDDKQCYVLISGIEIEPIEILVNPEKLQARQPVETQYNHEQQTLLIAIEGKSEIQIK